MRRIIQIVSWIALSGTILPPLLFFMGRLQLDQVKLTMLIATVLWFVSTSLWMGREPDNKQAVPVPPGQGFP